MDKKDFILVKTEEFNQPPKEKPEDKLLQAFSEAIEFYFPDINKSPFLI